MQLKKYKMKEQNLKKFYLMFIIISTLFMSIAYAQVSGVELNIIGTTESVAQKGVFITDVEYTSNSDANISESKINNYYQTMLHSTITLGDSSSSNITYTISVYNNSDNDYYFFSGTTYASEFYSNSDITFSLSGIEEEEIIEPKQTKTFTITFSYASSNTANKTLDSYLNFKFETTNVSISSYEGITIVAGNSETPQLIYTGIAKSIEFTSSDETIALIDSETGLVTGAEKGTAEMTVTITNYNGMTETKTCTVTVLTANYSILNLEKTKYYNTLESAYEDAISDGGEDEGGTIKVVASEVSDDSIETISKNITLDTNGNTLTRTKTINVEESYTLTITGTGILRNDIIDAINNYGNLEMTGGTIISETSVGIYNNNGNVNVTEGVITGGINAVYNGGTGAIYITGGTLTGGEISEEIDTVGDYATIYNSLTGNIIIEGTAEIVNSNSACIYNKENGIITMQEGTLTSEKNVGICNNGEGKVNVTGGTITVGVNAVYNGGTGTVEITGGNLTGGIDTTDSYSTIYNISTGTVTIGGTAEVINNNSNAIYNYEGTITIEGGSFQTKSSSTIYNYNKGSINVSGGEIVSETFVGIFNNETGTVNISGGTITTGGCAIYNYGTGTIDITGGTITGGESTTGSYSTIYNYETGNIAIGGTAEIINNKSVGVYNYAGGEIVITGGKVTTTGSHSAIFNNSLGTIIIEEGEIKATNSVTVYNNGKGQIIITGGTFLSTKHRCSTIYNYAGGIILIKGGTIDSYYVGVWNQSGTVEITGGIISGATYSIYNLGTISVSGATLSGSTYGV